MPQRNTIRKYAEKNYYHIYNRGVEKRFIFGDSADYQYFLSVVENYLTPKPPLGTGKSNYANAQIHPFWRKLLEKDEIELVCYCLMPNHFHFLLKQNTRNGITKFMRRLSNAYVRYFNKKYDRVGSLFQGKFKSVLIDNDKYLLHLSRYIHLNPSEFEVGPLSEYKFSSYPEYLGMKNTWWIHKEVIENFFKPISSKEKLFLVGRQKSTYRFSVEGSDKSSEVILGDLILEN